MLLVVSFGKTAVRTAQPAPSRSEATDLRHHLPKLGLGDVGHAGVDDVYDLFRFQITKHGRTTQHTEKGRSRQRRARETYSRRRVEHSGFGNEHHLVIS